MSDDNSLRLTERRGWSQRFAATVGIIVVGTLCVCGVAALWKGAVGLRWALLALSICGGAALLSVAISRFVRGPQAALWMMLVGMGIRMTAALTGCLVVYAFWREGIQAGFGWYLVAAYLLTLAADIVYMLPTVERPSGTTPPAKQRASTAHRTLLIEGELHG